MNSNDEKLNIIEASFLIVIVMIVHIISNLPNLIISEIGTSSIINSIYVFALVIIYFLIVNKLFKPFIGLDILDVAKYTFGSFYEKILSLLYIAYLLFASGMLLRRFAEILKVIYFHNVSIAVIILLFLITGIIANTISKRALISANTIIMPALLTSVIVIFVSAFSSYNFNSVFPVFGYGLKNTFVYGSSNIYCYGGLIFIFLIMPFLKNCNDLKKVGLTSIILSGGFLILSVSSVLMLFPFIKDGTNALAVYLSSREVDFGRFLQRSDALFMFIWMFAFISYLSVILFYVQIIRKKGLACIKNVNTSKNNNENKVSVFQTSSSKRKDNFYLLLSSIIIFIVALSPNNVWELAFLEKTIYKYFSLIVVYSISFFTLLIGYFKKRRSNIVQKKNTN